MASILEKVMAKVEKVAAKKAIAEKAKSAKRLTALQGACKGLPLEFIESGKTLIVAYKGHKVGVLNGGGPQAAAVTEAGSVQYVKLTATEFAEYAKAIIAKLDKAGE